VFAMDQAGQETGSLSGRLLVDRTRPRVRLARRGRTLTVKVSDGGKRVAAGLRPRSVRIVLGDGRRARIVRRGKLVARARHTYPAPGSYRIEVRARDEAGNRVALRRRVRIR
jgi:hypothetical protein